MCLGLVLVACATKSVPTSGLSRDALVSAIRMDGVNVVPGTSVDYLEKTKTKVAAARTLEVASMLLGGGGRARALGPRNTEPVGGYSDLEHGIETFSEMDRDRFQQPAEAMTAALELKLRRSGISVGSSSRFSISSRASDWSLDYDKMGEADNYRVYYAITTEVMDGDRMAYFLHCHGASKASKSLDDWRANDKRAVRVAAAAIGDLCANKLMTEIGVTSET